MLKPKLQYFGHLIQRTDSLEKTLVLGMVGGRCRRDDRGWDGWMASLTQWPWVWVSSRSWRWTGKPGMLQSMGSQKSQTLLSNITELILNYNFPEYSWKWVGFDKGLEELLPMLYRFSLEWFLSLNVVGRAAAWSQKTWTWILALPVSKNFNWFYFEGLSFLLCKVGNITPTLFITYLWDFKEINDLYELLKWEHS